MSEPVWTNPQTMAPAHPAGSGSEQLAQELQILAGRIRRAAGSAANNGGVAPAAVLVLLREIGPMTVPKVAELRGTSRQNIQELVNRLQSRGLVRLEQNPAHRRSKLVVLTEAGEACLQTLPQPTNHLAALLARVLSSSQLEGAQAVVEQLNRCFGGASPARPAPGVRQTRSRAVPDSEEQNDGSLPLNLL